MLSQLNDKLAQANRYHANVKKRITALIAIRNSAAHGNLNDFTEQDVANMINEVEQFLANHLTD